MLKAVIIQRNEGLNMCVLYRMYLKLLDKNRRDFPTQNQGNKFV